MGRLPVQGLESGSLGLFASTAKFSDTKVSIADLTDNSSVRKFTDTKVSIADLTDNSSVRKFTTLSKIVGSNLSSGVTAT